MKLNNFFSVIFLLVVLTLTLGCSEDSYNPTLGPRLVKVKASQALKNVGFLSEIEKETFLSGEPIPVEKLEMLSRSISREVRHLAAFNSNVNEAILVTLSKDSELGVRQAVANSSIVSEKILRELVKDDSKIVRSDAMTNPAWSPVSLEKLYEEGFSLDLIARNPSTPVSILWELVKRDQFIAAAVASNPAIQNDLILYLMKKNNKLISIRLCGNFALSKELLTLLAERSGSDINECVRNYMRIRNL
jgi:hypothetical protein